MSSNQYTTDVATRHQLFIQRYGAGVAKDYVAGLKRVQSKVLSKLSENELTQVSGARLRQINLDIDQLISGGYDKSKTAMIVELNKFALSEAEFTASMVGSATVAEYSAALPATNQIETALKVKTFSPKKGQLLNIEQAVSQFGAKQSQAIKLAVTDGYLLGETNAQISSKIKDLGRVTARQADTLARTMTNHTASIARSETIAANSDVLEGVQWLATLDDRTTLTCAGRDGEIYPINSDYPQPPAHFNCRSTLNMVVDPQYDLGAKVTGERPQVGAKGAGTTSAKTTFGGWLKKQPAGFQDEYFSKFPDGDARAKLFRKGGLKIDKFTDNQGAVYSLDRLRELNPIAFAKAEI